MKVQPYLFLHGRCEEALEFYKRAVGAEVTNLMHFKDSPEGLPPGMPKTAEKLVMHAAFRVGETTIYAADGMSAGQAKFEGFSLSLLVRDDAEANKCFSALSQGGTVSQPLTKTFFSSSFGMVTDRFGVPWMVLVSEE